MAALRGVRARQVRLAPPRDVTTRPRRDGGLPPVPPSTITRSPSRRWWWHLRSRRSYPQLTGATAPWADPPTPHRGGAASSSGRTGIQHRYDQDLATRDTRRLGAACVFTLPPDAPLTPARAGLRGTPGRKVSWSRAAGGHGRPRRAFALRRPRRAEASPPERAQPHASRKKTSSGASREPRAASLTGRGPGAVPRPPVPPRGLVRDRAPSPNSCRGDARPDPGATAIRRAWPASRRRARRRRELQGGRRESRPRLQRFQQVRGPRARRSAQLASTGHGGRILEDGRARRPGRRSRFRDGLERERRCGWRHRRGPPSLPMRDVSSPRPRSRSGEDATAPPSTRVAHVGRRDGRPSARNPRRRWQLRRLGGGAVAPATLRGSPQVSIRAGSVLPWSGP